MKKLIKKRSLWVLLILILIVTQSISQTVLIDSKKETTLLDKEATIAVGNMLKNYETLQILYGDSKDLINSLWEQIGEQKKSSELLLFSVIKPLEDKNYQMGVEVNALNQQIGYNRDIYEIEIKEAKKKKWKWLGIGMGIGATFVAIIVVSS